MHAKEQGVEVELPQRVDRNWADESIGWRALAGCLDLAPLTRHALEQLPGEIEQHEAEITRLRAILADPGLYGRDPAGFGKITAALEEREAALRAAEERWLELEMLRESLLS